MKSFLLYLFLLINLLTNFVTAEIILPADIVEGQDSNKNYMKEKAHFEKNVNGWRAYSDAAGTRPVDGTGGSPTITCTRSTTSPITGDGSLIITKDAANRQGQGCSAQFTIGNEMKAKVMQIEMDYRVVSGTFAAGSSTADSDLIVYIYDVTNSKLIEPSTIKFYSRSTTLPEKFVANFQTSATGTTYNLIIHAASTSASAYVVMLDNFKATPSRYVYGTPISDWVPWTPTGTWVSNTTYAGLKRRVGDTYEYQVSVSTTGAPTATNLFINLQETIDTAKVVSSLNKYLGEGIIHDNGTDEYKALVVYQSPTQVFIRSYGAGGTYVNFPSVNATTPMTWANTDSLNIRFSAPIVGLASSTQQSDGYDGRKVNLKLSTNAGSVATAATTWTTLTFTTPEFDDVAGWNGTDTYTFKSAGDYEIGLLSGQNSDAAAYYRTGYRINGGTDVVLGQTIGKVGGSAYVNASTVIRVNAGDTLQFRVYTEGTQGANALRSAFVKKVLAPTTISATEKVVATYKTLSSTTITSGTALKFTTSVEDSHARYNTSTGAYLIDSQGTYEFIISGINAGAATDVKMFIGATDMGVIGSLASGSGRQSIVIQHPFNAGDSITFVPQASNSATDTIGWLMVKKIK